MVDPWASRNNDGLQRSTKWERQSNWLSAYRKECIEIGRMKSELSPASRKYEPNPVLWLGIRYWPRLFFFRVWTYTQKISWPIYNNFDLCTLANTNTVKSHVKALGSYIGVIDQLFRSIWLVIGQIPFFAWRSINSQRIWPISSHLDQTNLVNKGFIIWLWGKCFLRDKAGSP